MNTRLKHIKQKIVNRFKTNYIRNFTDAQKYTSNLGLTIPKFNYDPEFELSDKDKKEIRGFFYHYFYERMSFNLEDLAFKCMRRSNEVKSLLKEVFNIDAVLTNGSVYQDYMNLFDEPKSKIEKRLHQECFETIDSHTWLTLPNYDVIDITIMPTVWVQYDRRSETEDNFKGLLWTNLQIDHKPFLYKPVFLGFEYFEKVKIKPKIHQFVVN